MKNSEKEKWLPVVGYEGLYDISTFGRIRSYQFSGKMPKSGMRKIPKVLNAKVESNGYRRASLYKNKKVSYVQLSRLVATAFLENKNNYPVVNHLDGCKSNDVVTNLEWCTASENVLHAFRTGLRKSPDSAERKKRSDGLKKAWKSWENGVYKGSSKLSKEQVLSIRNDKRKQVDIAKAFSISQGAVSRIKTRSVWNGLE